MMSWRSPFTAMVFQVLHSIAHGASASRGTATLVEGANLNPRWKGSPTSGGKSPLESCIARANGSSARLTTNSPVRSILTTVSLTRPSGLRLEANMQGGGSSQKRLKKTEGAACTTAGGADTLPTPDS